MGPWQILGAALASPFRHILQVVQYFAPALLAFALAVLLKVSVVYLAMSQGGGSVTPTVSLLKVLHFLAFAASVAMIVAIADGLVDWHRHFALPASARRDRRQRSGRTLRLFWQWLLIGLGFVVLLYPIHYIFLFVASLVMLAVLGSSATLDEAQRMFGWLDLLACIPPALAAAAFAALFTQRSLRLPYIAANTSRHRELPAPNYFEPRHDWLPWTLAASIALPAAVVQIVGAIAASIFGLSPSELLASESAKDMGEASDATRKIASSLSAISLIAMLLVCLVQLFYPILTFATTVSLYYREHLRDRLQDGALQRDQSSPLASTSSNASRARRKHSSAVGAPQ